MDGRQKSSKSEAEDTQDLFGPTRDGTPSAPSTPAILANAAPSRYPDETTLRTALELVRSDRSNGQAWMTIETLRPQVRAVCQELGSMCGPATDHTMEQLRVAGRDEMPASGESVLSYVVRFAKTCVHAFKPHLRLQSLLLEYRQKRSPELREKIGALAAPLFLEAAQASGLPKADQEDIAQQALKKFWEAIDKYRGGSTQSLILTIIKHEFFNALKSAKARVKREERVVQAHGQEDRRQPIDDAMSAELKSRIDNLPRGPKEAFVLKYLEGLSWEQTADRLSLKVERVHQLCAQAVSLLGLGKAT